MCIRSLKGIWEACIQQGGYVSNLPRFIEVAANLIADALDLHQTAADQPHVYNVAWSRINARERYKSALMLSGVDLKHYIVIKSHCENAFTSWHDECPMNTTECLLFLNHFRVMKRLHTNSSNFLFLKMKTN